MRFSPALFALGCLLTTAGVRWCEAATHAQTAPTPARAFLEQMSPAERKNSSISVEFESSDYEAVLLGHEVERLWNGGEFDEALAQLGDLETGVGHVAIGNCWRRPLPTAEAALWGRDVRIGNRDSIRQLAFGPPDSSGNLFVVLRRGRIPHLSVCMSADGGATWRETFTWSGSPPTATDVTVIGDHLYVVYNSPGENARQIRLRRFRTSTGKSDTFQYGGIWVVPCTLAVGDTMKEVSIVAYPWAPTYLRQYMYILVSDGSILWSWSDGNACQWRTHVVVGSGASHGLDATANLESESTYYFCSYYDANDTLRIYGRLDARFSLSAGSGRLTSISAYRDTVVCVFEDGTASPRQARYLTNYGDCDTWKMGILGDSGIAADAPAVTARTGGGFAASYRQVDSAPELRFLQRPYSGPGGGPVPIAEHEPGSGRPEIVDLGGGVYGVAYLSDTRPVVGGVFFDRSDWVYGVADQQPHQASSRTSPATVVRRVLVLADSPSASTSPSWLLDATGRKALDLKLGTNDVRALAPGVYFIVTASPFSSPPERERVAARWRTASVVSLQPPAVIKIVVQH